MKSCDEHSANDLDEDIPWDSEDLASELEQAQKHISFLERALEDLERENQRIDRNRIDKLRRLEKITVSLLRAVRKALDAEI
jgi:16S rRNA G527 N7-methylase RsmG